MPDAVPNSESAASNFYIATIVNDARFNMIACMPALELLELVLRQKVDMILAMADSDRDLLDRACARAGALCTRPLRERRALSTAAAFACH